MNCKNLRRRTKKGKIYIYCTIKRKTISYEECKNCHSKEYKKYKPIKSRTNKQTKKEKERFSIIYSDLTKCCECGLKIGDFDKRINMYTQVEKNEVFSGAYRSRSIEDGMVAPMCIFCHKLFHKDRMMNLIYKVRFQKEYMKNHSLDQFIKRYGQNFIYKLEQKKRS